MTIRVSDTKRIHLDDILAAIAHAKKAKLSLCGGMKDLEWLASELKEAWDDADLVK